MANVGLKMKLILWKNCIIRRRKWFCTIVEIIVPISVFLLLATFNKFLPDSKTVYINETTYYGINDYNPPINKIYFAPNNTNVKKIMAVVKEKHCTTSDCIFKDFDTESKLVASFLEESKKPGNGDLIAVVFNNIPGDKLPNKLDYRIRTKPPPFNIENLYSNLEPFEASEYKFYELAFGPLQQTVDSAFIDLKRKESSSAPSTAYKRTYQQLPDPPHEMDSTVIMIFTQFVPLLAIIAFSIIFMQLLQNIMGEKSSGIKELMKMMGLKSWMLWSGWYIHAMIVIIIVITVSVILIKVPLSDGSAPVIKYSDEYLVWIFLFLYCTSGICFCFMCSTLFQSQMLAQSISMTIWVLTAFPVMFLMDKKQDTFALHIIRNLLLFLPNSSIFFGFQTMYGFETRKTGMHWSNIFAVPNDYNPFHSMGKILLMLILDSIIFLLLTLYIDEIHPGEFGVGKSWNFPLQKSYWCPQVQQDPHTSENNTTVNAEIEPVPPHLQPGIVIKNLKKEFKAKKAVNGLNLTIYTNQLTILLGHNGAGKTTTMNIITGMVAPTSGTVLVGGYNIKSNLAKVRESLGLCPQHNVQFPNLTVLEHLMFFGMLKGMTKKQARVESLNYLARLSMSAKANKQARTLSGGMKRRLSLGMALIGNTQVLMLDEPTSGMDPEARREIWDLLLSMRGERTILITTHFMEEADILGDRIAIMHGGQLMCYGTSLFLKKHYGTGYTLSILLSKQISLDSLKNTIANYVPNVKVKNISGTSVKYELPTNDTTALTSLFLNLEGKKNELGIASYGVSFTTMDDVFLKVGKIADETDGRLSYSETNSETPLLNLSNSNNVQERYNTGISLLIQQFSALVKKRYQYTAKKRTFTTFALLLPFLAVIFIMSNIDGGGSGSKNISREFHLSDYAESQTFYSYSPQLKDLAEFYKQVVSKEDSVPMVAPQVSDAVIELAAKDMTKYNGKIIAAAELNSSGNTLNAMYGRFPLHGLPISINLISNALLKYYMNDKKTEYSITTSINPIGDDSEREVTLNGIMWINVFPLALWMLVSYLLSFPTDERITGVKHLQIMSGVSRISYWLSNYFFDMFIFLFVTAGCVSLLMTFSGALTVPVSLAAFSLLMILFGLAVFPFFYFCHYKSTTGSVNSLTCYVTMFFGMIFPIVISVWESFPDAKKEFRERLTIYFMLIPHFAYSYGLYRLVSRSEVIFQWDKMTDSKRSTECSADMKQYPCCKPESDECKKFYNYFTGDQSLLTPVLFLSGEIFVYFILFLFVDYGLLKKCLDGVMDSCRSTHPDINKNLDSDVADEQRRVTAVLNTQKRPSRPYSADVLLVSNLRKWFGKFHAVKGLTFGVKEQECFGLLGINGAGKTTTFKMLTGEIFPSTGTARIHKYSLSKNTRKYLKQIGYCPQFDAFNTQLTTRQMLTCFANLRGIPKRQVDDEVDKWFIRFDIMQYQNVLCSKMSGGNQRKLSTAMALIGEPTLIMLDEPTSGVDPVARRNLWNILTAVRKSGTVIVLTSHSMDECEALCDRLAIMVDGQLKCLGEIQHLKNKFGKGFTAALKLQQLATVQDNENVSFETEVSDLKSEIENKFECTLKDEHKGMLMYHITDENATIGTIFAYMEQLKQNSVIVEDFTVGDTTLEQVFLSFASEKLAAGDKKNYNTKRNSV